MMIHNIIELADHVGVPSCFTGDYEAAIERVVYKNTECGCTFSANEQQVEIAGYAEGADAECPVHVIEYPFDAQRFWSVLQRADDEGCEMWLRWNVDPVECPRCGEIELYAVYEDRETGIVEYECECCLHFEIAGGWAARPLDEGVGHPKRTETGGPDNE